MTPYRGAVGALAALALSSSYAAPDFGPREKPKPKASGRPIPEGTMTRQQRRAAERAAKKGAPQQ